MSFVGCPNVIPYTKFEHFGIIRFLVMLRTNKQTNRRTRTSYPRRPTESASRVGNQMHLFTEIVLIIETYLSDVNHQLTV